MSAPVPTTVLIADPHPCARAGVRAVLGAGPEFRVVGEADDGAGAVARADALDPDLVVLELALPGLDGAQVTARLRDGRDRNVLVLTACEDPGTVRLLRGAGARGYVLKRSPAEQLVRAALAVAAGGTWVDPGLADGGDGCELSDREAEVVRATALGHSNKGIAGRLGLSVKTVETYKARAMGKLGLRTRVDLVRFAAACGWLAADPPAPLIAPEPRPS